MATLPPYWKAGRDADSTTANQAVSGFNNLRDLVAQLPGAWPATTVTIASNAIAPWIDTGATVTAGAFLRLATGGSGSVTLNRIDPTGLFDPNSAQSSRLLLLQIESASGAVTLAHSAGGLGQILTADNQNWPLTHPNQTALLVWDPGPKAWRALGILQAPVPPVFPTPVQLQAWATNARPNPSLGRIGFNTTLQTIDAGNGSAWAVLKGAPQYIATTPYQGGTALITFNHNLGLMPDLVIIRLRCLTAEHGYSVNDEVPLEYTMSGSGAVLCGIQITSTRVVINQRASIHIRRASPAGGDPVAITANYWEYVCRVWV